jgi:hypothetical protein
VNWEPPDEVDREVRQWMKAEGFEVNATHYDLDREIYGWQQEGDPSYALRIVRYVLEYYTAAEIVGGLERLKVAQVMREHPHLIVRSKGDTLVLDTLTGAPRTPPPRRNF